MFICPTDPGQFTPATPTAGPGSAQLYMPGSYKAMGGLSDGIISTTTISARWSW